MESETTLELYDRIATLEVEVAALRAQLAAAQEWRPVPAVHQPAAYDHNLILDYDGKNRTLTLLRVTPVGYDNVCLAIVLPDSLDLCRRTRQEPPA